MPRGYAVATCQCRQPEGVVLYRTIQTHLDTFLARTAGDEGGGLPRFVTRELRAYLRCGILEHGCLHVRCERCGDDMLVPPPPLLQGAAVAAARRDTTRDGFAP